MNFRMLLAMAVFAFAGCSSTIAVYEPPVSAMTATLTLVNDSDFQAASFATFEDGSDCTGKRYFRPGRSVGMRPGISPAITISPAERFTLYANLETVADEELGVDFDLTGGGPVPVVTNSVAAIGCSAMVTFEAAANADYRATLGAPQDSDECQLTVVMVRAGAMPTPVKTTRRQLRDPGTASGRHCN